MQQNANLLAKYIHQMSGKKLKVIDEPVTSNAIILATGLNADNAEAYQLKVTQDNVTITGTSEAGTFMAYRLYGSHSQLQTKET